MRKLTLACIVALLAPPAGAQEPLSIHLITPCRYLDTRVPGCIPGAGVDCPQGPFVSGQTRLYLVQASARCPLGSGETPIPLGAKGLVLNVTATAATAPGSLRVYSTDEYPQPVATTLSFVANVNATNTTIVKLGQEQGQYPGYPIYPDLAVYAWVPGGTVHVVLDLVGYLAQW